MSKQREDQFERKPKRRTLAVTGMMLLATSVLFIAAKPNSQHEEVRTSDLEIAEELPLRKSDSGLSQESPGSIGGDREASYRGQFKDGIERFYVSNASLSDEDVEKVLELAEKRGISKVAKISTHYLLPSSFRSIKVEGAPVENGREISRSVLSVTRKSWSFPDAKPGKADIVSGEFWAGQPYLRKQVILRVGAKTYLCNSVDGMSFEEAESIIGKFISGSYKVGEKIRERGLEQIDWTSPTHFRKTGDSIRVGFLAERESDGFFDLIIKTNGEGIRIEQWMQAMP